MSSQVGNKEIRRSKAVTVQVFTFYKLGYKFLLAPPTSNYMGKSWIKEESVFTECLWGTSLTTKEEF